MEIPRAVLVIVGRQTIEIEILKAQLEQVVQSAKNARKATPIHEPAEGEEQQS